MILKMKIIISLLFLFFFSAGCSSGEEGIEKVLFAFERKDALQGWVSINDNVMGGVSSGEISWDNGMAVFRGDLSLENNGGFSSTRSPEITSDIVSFNGLSAMIRGDGRKYSFTLQGASGDSGYLFQSPFLTKSGKWEEIKIPFSDFVATFRGISLPFMSLNLKKIKRIGILIADKKEGPFKLDILWFKVF